MSCMNFLFSEELMALVEDLESEMLKTVSKRREYNTKIMNNYRKTLDLKFDNLVRVQG